ncbi:MAG: hypothetical protein IPO87_17870 [Flavobacteriales bacterium]|nr:hypothetical protein [Flavobacteriales bacterium]
MATRELRRYDIIHDKIVRIVETKELTAELLKIMRLFDHEQCECGVMNCSHSDQATRKRHKAVKDLYDRLADILRRAGLRILRATEMLVKFNLGDLPSNFCLLAVRVVSGKPSTRGFRSG